VTEKTPAGHSLSAVRRDEPKEYRRMSAVADARAAGLVVRPTRLPDTTAVAYPDGSVEWIRDDGFCTHFSAEQWKNMWIERHLRAYRAVEGSTACRPQVRGLLGRRGRAARGPWRLALLVMGAVAAYVVACLPFLILMEGDLAGWIGYVAAAKVAAVAAWWVNRLDKRDAATAHVFRASDSGCALDCSVCGQDAHEVRHVG
jgi:hypothetical protein